MRFFMETVIQLIVLCAIVYAGGYLVSFLFE